MNWRSAALIEIRCLGVDEYDWQASVVAVGRQDSLALARRRVVRPGRSPKVRGVGLRRRAEEHAGHGRARGNEWVSCRLVGDSRVAATG